MTMQRYSDQQVPLNSKIHNSLRHLNPPSVANTICRLFLNCPNDSKSSIASCLLDIPIMYSGSSIQQLFQFCCLLCLFIGTGQIALNPVNTG